jgi:hypothetical protein
MRNNQLVACGEIGNYWLVSRNVDYVDRPPICKKRCIKTRAKKKNRLTSRKDANFSKYITRRTAFSVTSTGNISGIQWHDKRQLGLSIVTRIEHY